MSNRIPTLQLVYSPFGLFDDPAGAAVVGSESSANSVGWYQLGFDYPGGYSTFAVYEDGAPMANGRVFQVSCFGQSTGGAMFALGPTHLMPPNFPAFLRCNVPIIYITDDDVYTCIYSDTPFSSGGGSPVAAFMRGKFMVAPGSTAILPPYLVPAFIDPADLAASVLGGLGYIYASDNVQWGLFTHGYLPFGMAIGPLGSNNTGVVPPSTIINERPQISQYDNRVSSVVYGGLVAGVDHLMVRLSDARCGKNIQLGTGPCSLRTYRRGDAHATYDWPGVFTAF